MTLGSVEVSIDGGAWTPARLSNPPRRRDPSGGLAWRFWSYDWGTPAPAPHTIASRAISVDGDVQPSPDDPIIATKRTYWESNGQITRSVSIP